MMQATRPSTHTPAPALLCLAIASGLCSPSLLAQETNDAATTLDQVTVTARQRSERLQDVPIAVTAFNAADIRNAGISHPRDFIALTPNVNLSSEEGGSNSFITIRGIAQVRNSEQPVAVVVDGVPQISGGQFNQELFDIAQVEVLKGPQGALYGNNSIGGAINITTTAPGDTSGGYAQAGFGKGGLRRTQGSFGAPLDQNGRWRGQVSAMWSDYGGQIKNEYLGQTVDHLRSRGVRLRLIGEISERLNLDIQASDGNDHSGQPTFVLQRVYGVSGDANNPWLPYTANNPALNERAISQVSFKLDWQHDWGSLTSISAWSRVNEHWAWDQSPYTSGTSLNPLPGWTGGGDGSQARYMYERGFSQELRLTSNSGQRLRWIVGAYGRMVERYRSSAIGQDLGLGIIPVFRVPNPAGSANPTNTFRADDNANDTYAVFGQLAYDLTPELEAALAMRYDHARREQTDVAPPAFSATTREVRTANFNSFQPKLSLTWKPHERLSGFASIGRGFSSGGFNQIGTSAAAAAAGITGTADKYDQETADSYELGIKSRPLHWLELNASTFYTDLENQHYFVFIADVGAQVIAPIDKTRLQGVELEIKAIPSRYLTLFGSYGYTDSEIRKNSSNPSVVGNRSPYVPQSTVNLGAQYKLELGEHVDTTFRVDYRRMGAQYWDTLNSTERSAVNLLDARMILQSTSGAWSLTLWGRNLTNKTYLAEWVLGGFARRAQPRTYGADFRVNF